MPLAAPQPGARSRRTYKALAALAAVVALVTVNASPSAAETTAVTGGTLSVNLTPVLTQVLGGTTGSCTSTITGEFTTSLTSATFNLNLLSHFAYNGGNYIFRLTGGIHTSSAHITTGTNTSKYLMDFDGSTTSTNITFTDVMVYNSDSATDCDPSNNTQKCGSITAVFPHFYGLLTVPTGTSITHNTGTSRHTVPVSSTIIFSGSSTFSPVSTIVANIAAAGCTPPFSALNGKQATIAGLTSHVTA